jgi:hypothetical protein
MATVVELPRLSDTMEEGVIAKWRVKVGDKVKRGQVIAEIETDKATMEFESFDAGVVLKLIADRGRDDCRSARRSRCSVSQVRTPGCAGGVARQERRRRSGRRGAEG